MGVLTQIGLEHAHPQLHRAVGDPGEQPAVDAPELDRDVERPRLAQLPERHERVGLRRGERRLVRIRRGEPERLQQGAEGLDGMAAAGLDLRQ